MAFDFPASPTPGQEYTPAGGPTYVWQPPKWVVKGSVGGLTTGGVTFGSPTGTLTQDVPNLFWDDTLNRLGIGTNAPATSVHTTGSVTIGGDLTTTGSYIAPKLLGDIFTGPVAGVAPHALELGRQRTVDGVTLIDLTTVVGADFNARIIRLPGADGAWQHTQTGTGLISWQHGGVDAMWLGTNGLTISRYDPQLHLATTRARGAGGVGFDMHDASGIKGWFGFVGPDDTFHINNNMNSAMYFYTNNAPRMWIDANGYVTAPSGFSTGVVYTASVEFNSGVGTATQALIYRDSGSLIISANRTVPGSERYWTFNGGNGQIYDSIGALYWNSGNDGHGSGLDADLLDGLHAGNFQLNLGFTPVRQGGGVGQGSNTIFLGWGTGGGLKVTVDSTDQGFLAFLGNANTWGGSQTAPNFTSTGTVDAQNYVWANNQVITNGPVYALGAVQTGGAGGTSAGFSFYHRDDGTANYLWYGAGNYAHLWKHDYGDVFQFHSTAFRHNVDLGADCGGPSWRWATVWCQSSTMATSDLREKDWRGGLTATEMAVAKALSAKIGVYRWLTDIERDGDAAKLHCGFAAQHVIELFEQHGLNALDYAFVRYDEWEESTSNGTLIGEPPELLDAEKNVYAPDTRTMEVITHPAGNRYSIMLADLMAFMAVGQQQRIDEMEARLAALEI